MSFSPLNFYTFAATRGQFLRPDVQALLKNASVGLYSDFANSHDPVLRREAEALRKRLDALLFREPSRPVEIERQPSRSFADIVASPDVHLPATSDAIASVARSRKGQSRRSARGSAASCLP